MLWSRTGAALNSFIILEFYSRSSFSGKFLWRSAKEEVKASCLIGCFSKGILQEWRKVRIARLVANLDQKRKSTHANFGQVAH